MQITINEAEIKLAIRNHILSQISVHEDQEIDIDLKATRGPEGYSAVIDINAVKAPEPEAPTKRTPKAQAKTAPSPSVKTDARPEPAAPAPEAEAETEALEVPEAETPTETSTGTTGEAPAAETGEDAPAAPAPKTTKPLFQVKKTEDTAAPAPVEASSDGKPRTSIFSNLSKKPDAVSAVSGA